MSSGISEVDIGIHPYGIPIAEIDENGLPSYKSRNLRAVQIIAKFEDPKLAMPGLRGLAGFFPDAVFAETLFFGGLPRNIVKIYKKIADNIQEWWDSINRITTKEPDFDDRMHREMTSEASIKHLEFLKPVIERLGIRPTRMSYYDGKLNMPYNIEVGSIDEVARLISEGYYDGRIPLIHAVFNGGEIRMEFPSWKDVMDVSTFAMRIKNGTRNGTLESILAKMNSIARK